MKQTTIRLPEELYKEIKQQAHDKGLDIRSIIIFILWNFVDDFS